MDVQETNRNLRGFEYDHGTMGTFGKCVAKYAYGICKHCGLDGGQCET